MDLSMLWARSGQKLARCPSPPAQVWPDSGQDLARIWPDPGQILARKRTESSQEFRRPRSGTARAARRDRTGRGGQRPQKERAQKARQAIVQKSPFESQRHPTATSHAALGHPTTISHPPHMKLTSSYRESARLLHGSRTESLRNL